MKVRPWIREKRGENDKYSVHANYKLFVCREFWMSFLGVLADRQMQSGGEREQH
jgi:hypothetical protein